MWSFVAYILMLSCAITHSSEDLIIPPGLCDEFDCKAYTCPDTSHCEYGYDIGPCNCCMVCAKGLHDHCGGMLNHAGSCGTGLICMSHPRYPQLPGICIKI